MWATSNAVYPMKLPFDRNLELIREFFNHFDSPLHEVMEEFKEDEAIESNIRTDYSWREILSEQLGISPREYEIFTDSSAYSIQSRYGLIDSDSLNEKLANAKEFCKRTDIKYKQLVELLKTEFINPAARHINKLEALQSAFNIAKEDNPSVSSTYGSTSLLEILSGIAKGNQPISSDISAIFPASEIEEEKFGGDLRQWIQETNSEIMSLLFLTPISMEEIADEEVTNHDTCDFGNLELKYPDPDESDLKEIEYWKFIHFIRLWRKDRLVY